MTSSNNVDFYDVLAYVYVSCASVKQLCLISELKGVVGCGKYKLAESSKHTVNANCVCTEGNLHQLPLSKRQNQQSTVVSVIIYSDRDRTDVHACTCLYISGHRYTEAHVEVNNGRIYWVVLPRRLFQVLYELVF